ncbi:MAG: ABC transporter permease, partial [Firmicutes bacterium]|nr:ABC transporter permease [Bacillota bacterium]
VESAVVLRHGLKNSMIPVVTMMAMQFASLLSGAVITESVFGIGGIGQLMVSAISQRDMPLLQSSVVFSTMIIIIGNLVADILYSFLDPKIRTQ